ncbi:hypothetical protein PsAD5_00135 [Pseudovibrio sp. Ad5]|nr:hypothetical protein PsAD5_00135 [Pseudovibrio sp. Ad5]
MAYGDYDGSNKPDKGKEGGSCNRTHCQAPKADWFNHGSFAWYCGDCRNTIENDPVNRRDWETRWRPKCGHPMFETREMIAARQQTN